MNRPFLFMRLRDFVLDFIRNLFSLGICGSPFVGLGSRTAVRLQAHPLTSGFAGGHVAGLLQSVRRLVVAVETGSIEFPDVIAALLPSPVLSQQSAEEPRLNRNQAHFAHPQPSRAAVGSRPQIKAASETGGSISDGNSADS
jgi:hypothetical protein